ncbi:N-formylglutamate amidohydrolase [Sphingomonas cavernae]|uniref:N-formylglutamate amidohydrolase n=1 Tax=Sphingomonas cavernae TaxID=2320861 RepID=UPI001EE632B3|nr:N-formylglutamate amidohydrolase [Sphingomonas cavernae]
MILSVPHAGRDYPKELMAASRLPHERLEQLEDRHADMLVGHAIDCGFTAIVARRARAWIDLNRHEREVDPDMIMPAMRRETLIRSAKVTGGLGLLPRRLRDGGDILRGRVAHGDLERRIEADHRPYHARISDLLAHARDRFGVAILLDVHSMPPLNPDAAQIVLGDRFGQSAAARYTALLDQIARDAGYRTASNVPYAGGHILAAHARPARGVHALQLEIDRSLYLAEDLRTPRTGLGAIDSLVSAMAQALSAEALGTAQAIAAE